MGVCFSPVHISLVRSGRSGESVWVWLCSPSARCCRRSVTLQPLLLLRPPPLTRRPSQAQTLPRPAACYPDAWSGDLEGPPPVHLWCSALQKTKQGSIWWRAFRKQSLHTKSKHTHTIKLSVQFLAEAAEGSMVPQWKGSNNSRACAVTISTSSHKYTPLRHWIKERPLSTSCYEAIAHTYTSTSPTLPYICTHTPGQWLRAKCKIDNTEIHDTEGLCLSSRPQFHEPQWCARMWWKCQWHMK